MVFFFFFFFNSNPINEEKKDKVEQKWTGCVIAAHSIGFLLVEVDLKVIETENKDRDLKGGLNVLAEEARSEIATLGRRSFSWRNDAEE